MTSRHNVERMPETDLASLWQGENAGQRIAAALAQIKKRVSPRQYQVFDLCVLKQWPVSKVSRMLGITEAQASLAKHRVGSLLRKEIERLTGNAAPPGFGDCRK